MINTGKAAVFRCLTAAIETTVERLWYNHHEDMMV